MVCFDIVIFWVGRKKCLVKQKDGSYFPNYVMSY